MKNNKEFFVGYAGNTPPKTRRFVKKVVIALLIALPVIGGLMAFLHNQYSTGKYEFGNLTEVEGYIIQTPIPMLKIVAGTDQNGDQLFQSVPLVGYGKFGSKGIVDVFAEKVMSETGKSLKEVKVVLQGTLAYNDGKAIFELTKKEKALISYANPPESDDLDLVSPKSQTMGEISIKGEIIDPKCYFGAMNPGRGKSHKSCAIMCIRGGIPPMLAVKNLKGEHGYYILLDKNKKPVNEAILEYVADPVEIKGVLVRQDDWFLLLIDPATAIQRL